MKQDYKGYFTLDMRAFDFKRGSLERDLLIELSYRENKQRLKGTLPIGDFYVSQRELGEYFEVSAMTINRALKKLVDSGCITVVYKSKTKNKPSIFRLECVTHLNKMLHIQKEGIETLKNEDGSNLILFPKRDKNVTDNSK